MVDARRRLRFNKSQPTRKHGDARGDLVRRVFNNSCTWYEKKMRLARGILILCCAPALVASFIGQLWEPIVSITGEFWKKYDYAWDSDRPWEARITVTCTEDKADFTRISCPNWFKQYKKMYDEDKGYYPPYRLISLTGTDYPHLMTNYSYLSNWDALTAYDRISYDCSKHMIGNLCTRAQRCLFQVRYYGSVSNKESGVRLINHDLQGGDVNSGARYQGGGPDATCNLCTITKCKRNTCSNGEYSLPPPGVTVEGTIISQPTCVPCPAGYWLTCSTNDIALGCTYLPPSDVQTISGGGINKLQWISKNQFTSPSSNIPMKNNSDWPMLVGQCYPCTIARNRLHYGELFSSPDDLFNQGFLSFTCPGGALPPLACPVHEMSKFDPVTKAATTCDCMHGYYRKDGVCTVCEAGHYCVFGAGKVRCPDDSYSLAGSSACTPCSRNVNICPENEALTRCVTGFQDKNSYCVDCGTCQQLWSGASAVPCYRLSSVGAV